MARLSRTEVVAAWDDPEVARRWLMLYPKRSDIHNQPAQPTPEELNMIVNSPATLCKIRTRLE